jgi:predicted transcriptional regulator
MYEYHPQKRLTPRLTPAERELAIRLVNDGYAQSRVADLLKVGRACINYHVILARRASSAVSK